ncbi:hypothetical protein Acor_83450 [Acrocarpospora corrugata]|uniref:4Fe-4S Wbl-type domain-containing protein n=1 Tax=Acrocarpospora corrugata TaxID=35763 RepID=A0A5M3WBR9_9ACTN|nr:WhiB family transcriptional regulator [Acrocarpospora corrugata]GES06276.1 hypothetical protein Acor_83450 [Acrocarpospora corrugata]
MSQLPGLRLVHIHPAARLLDLLTDELSAELAEAAPCGTDPELHTGPDVFAEESDTDRAAREDVAKSVCAGCPVQLHCLAMALHLRPQVGVWAGYTAEEIARFADPVADFSAAGA